MKKFIQKTVAGVSALAMTAALSATAVPAFADEYEAVQEAILFSLMPLVMNSW